MTNLSNEELKRLRSDWWHRFILGTLMCYIGLSTGILACWMSDKPIRIWYYVGIAAAFTVVQYAIGTWAWNKRVNAKKDAS